MWIFVKYTTKICAACQQVDFVGLNLFALSTLCHIGEFLFALQVLEMVRQVRDVFVSLDDGRLIVYAWKHKKKLDFVTKKLFKLKFFVLYAFT